MEVLCAQSDDSNVEPSWTCHSTTGNDCAGSTGDRTVLSCNKSSDTLLVDKWKLSRRQKKRMSEKKRKRRLFDNAFNLATKVSEQKGLLENTKRDIISLNVQKNLYKRLVKWPTCNAKYTYINTFLKLSICNHPKDD